MELGEDIVARGVSAFVKKVRICKRRGFGRLLCPMFFRSVVSPRERGEKEKREKGGRKEERKGERREKRAQTLEEIFCFQNRKF